MQDSSPNVFAWLVYRIEVFGRGGRQILRIRATLPQKCQHNIIYHLISTTWFAPPSRATDCRHAGFFPFVFCKFILLHSPSRGKPVKQGQQQEPEDELKQQQWQEEEEEENTHEQRDARV